jgi:hypothetical protein
MRTRCLAAAAGAVACALVVGCGSVPAGRSAGHAGNRATATRTGAPTEAGNRRLAESEASRLLALVPVPAHALRLGSAPASLSYPLTGLPAVQSLVDRSGFWRLPMSYHAALSWLAALRPAGLHRDGSGSIVRGGVPSEGFAYAGPVNRAWQSAELDVLVARDGDWSELRVDGLVVWVDPVPLPVTGVGSPLRVLASANCPRSDAGHSGVINPGPGLRRALVPPGRPRYGLTCAYYGLDGRPWQLRAQHRLDAAQAARLATSLARIPLSHVVGGVFGCPMDDGADEIIALSYPGRPDVDLWQGLSGCRGISNGYITTALP